MRLGTRDQLTAMNRFFNDCWSAMRQDRREAGLQRALAQRDSTGYCISAGEFHREINSVSVALTGPAGEVMAFNCGGPAFLFSEARLKNEVAPALIQMVVQIAADIGGVASAVITPRSLPAKSRSAFAFRP